MERYSNIDGQMTLNKDGGWVIFSDIKGTDQEIKEWMRKHAVHAIYPKCHIRKTGKCTCGLNDFITKTV